MLSKYKSRKRLQEEINSLKCYIRQLEGDNNNFKRTINEKSSDGSLFEKIAETSPVGITVVNGDGVITFANHHAEKILGLKRGVISGRSYNDPEWHITDFDGNSFPGEKLPFYQVKQTNKPVYGIRHAIEWPDGRRILLSINAAPLEDDSGKFDGMVASIEDITLRIQLEKALQENEKKFRNIVESSPIGMHLYRLRKDGSLVFEDANEAANKILNIDNKQFIGQTIEEAFPSARDTEIPSMYKRAASKGISWHSEQVIYEDNKIQGAFEVLAFQTSPGRMVALFNDITDRKKSEITLRESEEKYKALFESASDAIFLVKDGIIIDCNTMTLEMFDCRRDQIIGREPHRFSPKFQPDGQLSRTKALEKIQAALCGKTQFFEWKHKRYSGEVFDAEVSLNKIDLCNYSCLLAIVRDITERKRAEDALKKSERQFQELFNSVMEGIGLVDENENIIFCNPAYAKIFDVEFIDDLIGRKITEFLPDNQKEKLLSNMNTRKNGLSSQFEVEIITPKNNLKNLLVSVTPSLDTEGNYIGSIGAIIDITETKQLQNFASRAQRLETAGRVSGQIAHDFNNLLGPLTAYPEIIKRKLPEDHETIKFIEKMERAAFQMAEINQELLALGRRGHYNLEPINLNEIINHTLIHMSSQRHAKPIESIFDENLMNIKGGRSQISRVIINLVTNAWDALDDNGKVIIKTENFYIDDASANYGLIPKGEYVKLTISDSGSGIPDDIKAKIFDPFFTTKKTDITRGSGLGLSVVHAVMEDHKGFIDMESKVNEGTSFYLYFPITREKCANLDDKAISGGNERILVVDDDPYQRDVALALLKELGYAVTVVESGEAAVKEISRQSYDLVILDMIMPSGMDGTETYSRILRLSPSQRALIVSGYAETGRVKKALAAGAGQYIRKPLTLKVLARAVREELDKISKSSVRAATNI